MPMSFISSSEFEELLSQLPVDYVFPEDIIDDETGEILAEEGTTVNDILIQRDKYKKAENAKRAKERAKYEEDIKRWGEEDEEYEKLKASDYAHMDATVLDDFIEQRFLVITSPLSSFLEDYEEDQIYDLGYDPEAKIPDTLIKKDGQLTEDDVSLVDAWIAAWNSRSKELNEGIMIYAYNVDPMSHNDSIGLGLELY